MRLSEVTDAGSFARAIQDDDSQPVADNSAESIRAGFRATIIEIVDGNGDIPEKLRQIKIALKGMETAADILQQIAKANRLPSADPADDKLPPKRPPKPDIPKSAVSTVESFAAAVTGQSRLTEAETKDFAGCIVR